MKKKNLLVTVFLTVLMIFNFSVTKSQAATEYKGKNEGVVGFYEPKPTKEMPDTKGETKNTLTNTVTTKKYLPQTGESSLYKVVSIFGLSLILLLLIRWFKGPRAGDSHE